MEEPEHSQHGTTPPSSSSAVTTSTDGPSSSLPSSSQVQEEVENEQHENEENDHHQHHHHHHHRHHILLNHHRQQQQPPTLSYHVNISISDAPSTETRDDVWACLAVLVTFWFFGTFHPHLHFPLLHLLPFSPFYACLFYFCYMSQENAYNYN